MELFLLLGLPVLALALFDDDDDHPPQEEPEIVDDQSGHHVTGTDEDENLLVKPEFSGRIDAAAGNDRVDVTAEGGQGWEVPPEGQRWNGQIVPVAEKIGADETYEHLFFEPGRDVIWGFWADHSFDETGVDTVPGITEVLGGTGNDTIIAHGNDLFIDGGADADLINVSDARDVFVTLGDGDTLIGSDLGAIGASGTGSFDFRGGAAGEYLRSDGPATISGGGGSDTIEADGEGAVISGGDGDDAIYGIETFWLGAEGQYGADNRYIGDGSSTLDGGDGDDFVAFDLSDTVSGGAGSDSFRGYLVPGETAVLADFVAGEDSATLVFYDLDSSKIDVVEEEGDTLIRYEGAAVACVVGQTGLDMDFATLWGQTEWGMPVKTNYIFLS